MPATPLDISTSNPRRASSMAGLFRDRVAQTPDREAYRFPSRDGWESMTWRQTDVSVRRLAAGLLALGVGPRTASRIAASTRIEWVLADIAMMCAGAATTTVYPTTSADDVAIHPDRLADRVVVFAEDDDPGRQAACSPAGRAARPAAGRRVRRRGPTTTGDDTRRARGARATSYLADPPPRWRTRWQPSARAPRNADVHLRHHRTPQGRASCTHDCWTYNGVAVDALDILSNDDLQYLWLPLSHSFGKMLLAAQLRIGFPTAIDGRWRSRREPGGRAADIHGRPAAHLREGARQDRADGEGRGRHQADLFAWAFGVGQGRRDRLAGGIAGPARCGPARRRRQAGVRQAPCPFRRPASASSSPAARRSSRRSPSGSTPAGIVILEGYGLTETSACAWSIARHREPVRHRRAAGPRHGGADRRGRRDPDPGAERHARLPQPRPRRPPRR